MKGHQENFDKRGKELTGDCSACAAVQCMYNITSKKVLKVFEENPITEKIKQYKCIDIQDDLIAMKSDLTNID